MEMHPLFLIFRWTPGRRPARRAATFVFLVWAAGTAGCAGPNFRTTAEDLTIRNLTREPIVYTVIPVSEAFRSESKFLPPDAVHRFPGDVDRDIRFETDGKTVTYRLKPGRPYTFRYDEHLKLDLYEGSHGRTDAPDLAPFVPTPMEVVEGMLMLAQVNEKDTVFDLGSGDGRIVIAAAKKHGARAVGVELDPTLIRKSKEAAKEAGLEKQVQFRQEDATRADFSSATVLFLYLLPESNELLRAQLERQLRPGTRIVTHNYPIPGWDSRQVKMVVIRPEDGKLHEIYLYRR